MARSRITPQLGGDGTRDRSGAWLAALLVALAASHRLLFLWSFEDRSWPFSIFYFGDTRVFFEHALDLLRGVLHQDGMPFRPPLFPWVLAGVYAFVGADPATAAVPHLAVRTVFALLSSLTPALLFLLARPYLGARAALAFALPWVWFFGALVLAVAPVGEGVYLVVLLAVLIWWARVVPSPVGCHEPGRLRWWSGLLVGAGIGVLHLLRAEAVVIGIGLLVLTGWPRREVRLRVGLGWAAVLACGWGLALAPSTWIHWRHLTRANETLAPAEPLPTFVPVSLYGPLNLALANHPSADGRFSVELLEGAGASGKLDLGNPRHLDLVLRGERRAREWASAHPDQAVDLVAAKWQWALRAGQLGWGSRNWPGGLEGRREPVDVFVPTSRWGWIVWGPLAVFGAVTLWRRGPGPRRVVLVAGIAALAPAVAITLFFGYVRQALLWMPFALGFAGVGALTLFDLVRRGRSPSTDRSRPLLVVAALFLVVEIGLFVAGAPKMRASGAADERGRIIQDDVVELAPW